MFKGSMKLGRGISGVIWEVVYYFLKMKVVDKIIYLYIILKNMFNIKLYYKR